MTSADDSITSKEELNAALRSVILGAHRNGIEVEGGFDCRNGVQQPDWDVIVTEVQKNVRSE